MNEPQGAGCNSEVDITSTPGHSSVGSQLFFPGLWFSRMQSVYEYIEDDF